MPMAVNENVSYNFEVNVKDALSGLDDLDSAFAKIDNAFDGVINSAKQLGSAFNLGTKATNMFRKALAGLSGVAIGKYLANATKEGIEYYETVNLFNVAMKDSIDEGKEFIATMSEMYGLDPKSLMDYTGLFYELAYAVNVPQEAAEELAQGLTLLTTDVASLFNTEIDTVADNLMSGMRGMSRAVVKYGMDLRATTVEAYANSKGITAQFETMNEASREILRYVVMLDQASDAEADFALTLESPANQLRIFKEQTSQLGRAISRFIITPLSIALPFINGFVAAVHTMIDTIATILGFNYDYGAIRGADESADSATDSLVDMGNAAVGAGKKMKRLLAPFDELNIIAESAGGAAGGSALGIGEVDPAILKLLDEVEYKMEKVRLKAWDTRDAILAFFGFVPQGDSWVYSAELFEQNLAAKLPKWSKTIEALFDFDYGAFLSNVSLLFGSFRRIGLEAISLVTQDLLGLLGIDLSDSTLSEWINNLNANFFEFRSYLIDNESKIASFIAKVAELGIAFSVFATVAEFLTPFLVFFGALGFFATNTIPLVVGGFGVLQSIFGFLATVFGKLTSTYVYFSTSIAGLPIVIEGMATTLLAGIALLVAGFVDGFIQMWNKSEVFRNNFKVLVTNIMDMISSIVSFVKTALNVVWFLLEPFISLLGDLFQPLYPLIVNLINNIVGVFTGFVNILDGIFSGDLTLVFTGLKKMIAGIASSVSDIFIAMANAAVSVFVGAINFLGNLIYKFVSAAIGAINMVGGLIGIELKPLDRSYFTVDSIPTIVAPAVDFAAFATGGVVTKPTFGLFGEAGRSEAVIPLDNSPQMEQLINRIAERINGSEQIVKVYIGDREWDAFTYESSQRGKNLVGAQPIKEGRA